MSGVIDSTKLRLTVCSAGKTGSIKNEEGGRCVRDEMSVMEVGNPEKHTTENKSQDRKKAHV